MNLNIRKNWASYVCILTGIVMIAVGIIYFTEMQEFYGDKYSLTFGADFYTEIHEATVGVENAIREVHEIIRITVGYFLIFGGIIDIGFFVKKLEFDGNGAARKCKHEIAYSNPENKQNNLTAFLCPKCGNTVNQGDPECSCGQKFMW